MGLRWRGKPIQLPVGGMFVSTLISSFLSARFFRHDIFAPEETIRQIRRFPI